MILSNHICTVDQSQKLVKAGIVATSCFFYYGFKNPKANLNDCVFTVFPYWTAVAAIDHQVLPAFNSSELAYLLPDEYVDRPNKIQELVSFHRIDKPFGEDTPLWFPNGVISYDLMNGCETETIAKAQTLLYLLSKNAIDIKAANERLINSYKK